MVFFPANVRRQVAFSSGVTLFRWIDLPDKLTARLGAVGETSRGFVPLSGAHRGDRTSRRLVRYK
ncbi:MAG TPA: hypothetical protein VLL75_02300 [Vicinamibacteria bacterium]|nr:hypothetical protein [Vicinamibacteria bacterium]